MKQVPDFSAYLNNDFLLEEDMTLAGAYALAKGNTFRITKINGVTAHLKLSSTLEDSLPSLRLTADNIIKMHRSEAKTFEKIIKIWEADKDKFVVSKKSAFNYDDGKLSGHCINTGFHKVPQSHPDVYGMAEKWDYDKDGKRTGRSKFADTIMTFDYEHREGKKNIYSYQEGTNLWYSKACYEFMLQGVLEDIKVHRELSLALRKDMYRILSGKSFMKTFEMSIKKLNKNKFHVIK
jgi:hypothetical protein